MEAPWLCLRAWTEGIDGGALALHFGKNTAQRSHPASLEKQPVPQALSRQPQALSRQPHSRSSQTTGLLSLLEPDSVLLPRKASSGLPSHSKLEGPVGSWGRGSCLSSLAPLCPGFFLPISAHFPCGWLLASLTAPKLLTLLIPKVTFPDSPILLQMVASLLCHLLPLPLLFLLC
uniref:Uncharacterized protein n=1 Tax=Macaca fascicularis TaxID=9541 RepID=Q8HXH9_MACFA|nr:hypothetical protein [Macaca fascicularis]